jgi:uncharacterized protein (TIGR03000 family)
MNTKHLIRGKLILSAVIVLSASQFRAEAQDSARQCWFKFSIGWTPYDWDETGLGHYYGKPPYKTAGYHHAWVDGPAAPLNGHGTLPPAAGEEVPPVDAALVIVKLPDDAELWIDDTRTAQEGSYRRFVTPALEPGHQFVYTLRVRWHIKDAELTRVEKARVERGKSVAVNFLTIDSWTGVRAETLPTPRKLP